MYDDKKRYNKISNIGGDRVKIEEYQSEPLEG